MRCGPGSDRGGWQLPSSSRGDLGRTDPNGCRTDRTAGVVLPEPQDSTARRACRRWVLLQLGVAPRAGEICPPAGPSIELQCASRNAVQPARRRYRGCGSSPAYLAPACGRPAIHLQHTGIGRQAEHLPSGRPWSIGQDPLSSADSSRHWPCVTSSKLLQRLAGPGEEETRVSHRL